MGQVRFTMLLSLQNTDIDSTQILLYCCMTMLEKEKKHIYKQLVHECRNKYGEDLVTVSVFGSVARNTHTQFSDIDLLIIVRDLPRGRMNRIRDFEAVEKSLKPVLNEAKQQGWDTHLSTLLKTPEDVALGGYIYLDMVDDAVILYDKNGFFRDFLTGYKQKLENYNARKIPYKGAWYWEIKPDYRPGDVIDL